MLGNDAATTFRFGTAEYYHCIINSAGSIIDARHGPNKRDLDYSADVDYAVQRLPDRWTLEMRVPTAKIGNEVFRRFHLENGYRPLPQSE